ncbi:hypothetical protein [Bacillus sp. EB01]|uniref:hypothetical protein n=1 Tax=Bacillus sp. EB01 TaxID=1347086 RepID=UPI0005C67B7F|nr:hypothetical protein [Bacillus sp. EB01]
MNKNLHLSSIVLIIVGILLYIITLMNYGDYRNFGYICFLGALQCSCINAYLQKKTTKKVLIATSIIVALAFLLLLVELIWLKD